MDDMDKRLIVALMVSVLVSVIFGIISLFCFLSWATHAFAVDVEPEIITVVKEIPVEVTVCPAGPQSDDVDKPTASEDEIALAKMVWGEARGCSATEQAAAVWCALNRVDSDDPYYPDTIIGVVSQRGQFEGYSPDYPIEDDILALVQDVVSRWQREKAGEVDVGRVLPKEYLFFHGDGAHNHVRIGFHDTAHWDWSLPSPYTEDSHGKA